MDVVNGSVDQCSNTGSVGGDTITCDVTITNNFAYNPATPGTPTGLATVVTSIVCTGSAVCPVGGTVTSLVPITVITQCNNAGLGGASTVTCTVTVTNNLSGWPVGAAIDSSVSQCQSPGLVNTLTCVATPPGNNRPGTAGPGGQSVSQCNSSGGAGGTMTCTATAPPSEDTGLPITIQQCNASGPNGASTVTCTATITNNFLGTRGETPTPTTPTPTSPGATSPTGTSPTPTSSTGTKGGGKDTTKGSKKGTGKGTNKKGSGKKKPGGGSDTNTGGGTPGGAGSGQTVTGPNGGDTTTTLVGAPPSKTITTIPYTGLDIRIPIMVGIIALMFGLALRQTTARQRRRDIGSDPLGPTLNRVNYEGLRKGAFVVALARAALDVESTCRLRSSFACPRSAGRHSARHSSSRSLPASSPASSPG